MWGGVWELKKDGSEAHIIGWFSASLLQGEESNAPDGSWEPPRVSPHFPDLVEPLLPISADLSPALARLPTTPALEEEVLQQQSPLGQARELEAELPEQGPVAHGEPGAGGREKRGAEGGRDGGRKRKCGPDRNKRKTGKTETPTALQSVPTRERKETENPETEK